MAKRKISAYNRCVGAYLRGNHQGSPTSRMKAAAAKCKKGGTRRRRRRKR